MRASSVFASAGLLTCAYAAATLAACADDSSAALGDPAPDQQTIPEAGASDADADAEPATCSGDDCAYFSDVCSADTLCPNGPFGPNTIGGALDVRTQIRVLRGRSATDVWVAGALGAVAHFDGTSWTRSESGTQEMLRALWLRDSAEIAFGRLEALYSRGFAAPGADASAGGWVPLAPASAPDEYASYAKRLESAWAPAGSEWLWIAMRAEGGSPTSGLWRLRVAPSGVFEIGTGIPTTACTGFGCRDVIGIHGSSADDLWAVGYRGSTLRIAGAQGEAPTITVFNSQTWNSLDGVWAASSSEAWSVGAEGTIRHYRGDPLFWDVTPDVPTTRDLHAVWGSSATDVWAVGDGAVVLHYDGRAWTRVKIAGLGARRPDLYTVWMPSPGHVWIGGQGVVLSLGGRP